MKNKISSRHEHRSNNHGRVKKSFSKNGEERSKKDLTVTEIIHDAANPKKVGRKRIYHVKDLITTVGRSKRSLRIRNYTQRRESIKADQKDLSARGTTKPRKRKIKW